MIPRYSRPEMTAIWSPETKFRIWFEIEAHATSALAELGVVPREAAERAMASLEFLGDSVLGLIVSNYLCDSYPGGTEGELSRMKHRLVSAPTLAKASQELNLGDFLRFGRGEEKSGGRHKNALLADVFEAITGAIFLDGGLAAATGFVCHALRDELEGADPLTAAKADYKTMLQERLQAARRPAPRYAVIETLGPPHQRIFHVEVSWDGGSIRGTGHSIKAAEAAAARAALEVMAPDRIECEVIEAVSEAELDHGKQRI